ncbi:MAG TPA: hypothetical protein VJO12_18550 [Stellaceae bacterium]|nr:hypothetical protein [Stellaceae bacterium]
MTRNARVFAPAMAAGAAAVALLTTVAGPAAADSSSVRWKTIIGIIQAGNVVAGIGGDGQPWSTLGGEARVDLASGETEFEVRGLVLAGGNAIGTPDGIASVKGTLVCAAGTANQVVRDTAGVTLSAQGDAEFDGNIGPIPAACTPTNTAFLVRINNPPPGDRWIVNGAVRSSHGD